MKTKGRKEIILIAAVYSGKKERKAAQQEAERD
jgi:hypothetical protein